MLWLVGCAVVWALSVTAALAQDKRATAEQHAATCAHDAKGLKGEERERFLATCVKAHEADSHPAHGSQQEKMKTCNQEARERDLHGDERRAFMSSCLRG